MSDIGLTITPNVSTTEITIDTNTIQFTPSDIAVNIFTQGAPVAGGNNGQLQYNNIGTLDGVANTSYANGNITFQNLPNLKISGGSNSYFLQTDGTGNLTWAQGTVSANGNGVANGANTQIQTTDGTGNFVGSAGFTFNYISNTLAVPGDGIFTGNITSGNANLGNAAVANYFIGNGSLLTGIDISSISNGSANVRTFLNANVTISAGGNANVLTVTSTGININGNITGPANIVGDLNVTANTVLNTLRTTNAEVTIGNSAGNSNQGVYGIAIGSSAGESNQGIQAIAIGESAGDTNQGANAVAIGTYAGLGTQGANAVAVGAGAGATTQHAYSIILNATGANLNSDGANRFFVKPVRNANTSNIVYYNNSTGEISYDALSNITSLGNLTSLTVTGNTSIGGTTTLQQVKEKIVANSTAATGVIDYDILDGAIVLKTANASANFALNFRGNSTTTLNNTMSSNESMTCTFVNPNGANAYVLANIRVDGVIQTVYWAGNTGNAGTGTVNGRDIYTFNILKTAANTYTIFTSRTGYI